MSNTKQLSYMTFVYFLNPSWSVLDNINLLSCKNWNKSGGKTCPTIGRPSWGIMENWEWKWAVDYTEHAGSQLSLCVIANCHSCNHIRILDYEELCERPLSTPQALTSRWPVTSWSHTVHSKAIQYCCIPSQTCAGTKACEMALRTVLFSPEY